MTIGHKPGSFRPLEPWELAGWSREPRNGREWKMLKEGKPEPQPQKRWGNKYRCRRCKGTTYKVHTLSNGEKKRRCSKCSYKTGRDYYLNNPEASKKNARNHRIAQRKHKPVFSEGAATGSMTWARDHMPHMAEYVKEGIVVVESYGAPAFAIVSLEQARRLLK